MGHRDAPKTGAMEVGLGEAYLPELARLIRSNVFLEMISCYT